MTPGPLTTTGSSGFPVVTNVFAQVMLVRGLPFLHYGRAAFRKSMPKNAGTTIVFPRLNALATNPVPLVEGVPPTGKQLTKTSVTSVLKQYGDYITITDYFEMVVESPVLADAARALGEQAGQSIDEVFRDTATAGTSVSFGGGVSARSSLTTTTHKIDVSALRRAFRTLRGNNARPFTRIISAEDAYDTHPVREAFWAVTTPEVAFTLNTLPGYIPVANYPSSDGVLPGEDGSFEGIRFLISSKGKKYLEGGGAVVGDVQGTTYADVHTITIFGQNAFSIVPLNGNSFENIIHPSNSGGPTNPLNQYGTMAWKRNGTQLITDDAFMTRIEVTVGLINP